MQALSIQISTAILLGGSLIVGCSDESQVEDLRGANTAINADNEQLSGDDDCKPTSLALNDMGPLTYHSPQVQGVLNFCAGCHGQLNPRSGIDFSDYTRMVTSFSQQNILLSRILEQVENDHQYSRDSGLEVITAWHMNQYARGSADGGESDSPFFEGAKGENGIDLDGFDPFASDDDRASPTSNDANSCR